jgi:hypothetical protein
MDSLNQETSFINIDMMSPATQETAHRNNTLILPSWIPAKSTATAELIQSEGQFIFHSVLLGKKPETQSIRIYAIKRAYHAHCHTHVPPQIMITAKCQWRQPMTTAHDDVETKLT